MTFRFFAAGVLAAFLASPAAAVPVSVEITGEIQNVTGFTDSPVEIGQSFRMLLSGDTDTMAVTDSNFSLLNAGPAIPLSSGNLTITDAGIDWDMGEPMVLIADQASTAAGTIDTVVAGEIADTDTGPFILFESTYDEATLSSTSFADFVADAVAGNLSPTNQFFLTIVRGIDTDFGDCPTDEICVFSGSSLSASLVANSGGGGGTTPIPVPMSAPLLLGGVALLGLARRRG